MRGDLELAICSQELSSPHDLSDSERMLFRHGRKACDRMQLAASLSAPQQIGVGMTVHLLAYDTDHPGDTRDLRNKLTSFHPDGINRLALLVKTEGNADLNDYSRQYGLLTATLAISAFGGQALIDRSTFLFSTGCEGAITPFGYLFVDSTDRADRASPSFHQRQALTMGCARSRSLAMSEIGTRVHADTVAAVVRDAIADAGVTVDEVALVIIKTPVAGFDPETHIQDHSQPITSALSKAVGALGAGMALGEVDPSLVVPAAFDRDRSLFARRAMVFSGSEVDFVEVLALANKEGVAGELTIATGHLEDLLDADGVREMLIDAGLKFQAGKLLDSDRIAAILLKVGIAPDGHLRGRRTTVNTSSLDVDVHVRAAMSGLVGSIIGTTRAFISANTVHQAPPGGGLAAVIVRNGSSETSRDGSANSLRSRRPQSHRL